LTLLIPLWSTRDAKIIPHSLPDFCSNAKAPLNSDAKLSSMAIWATAEPGIEVYHSPSAADFVALLRASNPEWSEGTATPWAFRGHADDSWGLIPSAWRPANQTILAARVDATRRIARFTGQHILSIGFIHRAI
jgi:hypothetical protein